ncbi:MAG TPA: amidohydrolase family protein [Gemmatimonadaceae bacterium]|nr:amidohydrolase family protein [Gemmatimonadaceae bacterium]
MRLALLAAVLLTSSFTPFTRPQPSAVTIDNVTIVDVTNGKLLPHKTIVVEGTRIARILNSTAATKAAATLDGTGRFVIPGMWDMHIHAYFTNDTARFHSTSETMFPLFIVSGITGIRDMGSNLDAILSARDSIAAHQLIGPRIMASGPMLDGPETRYAAAIKVGTAEEARAAVRMLKQRGVDHLKVQSLVPRDAYFAIADEAAKVGLKFEGHVPNAITGLEAAAAHQYSFEHFIGVSDTNSALIKELSRLHLWQCPTMFHSLNYAADFATDPGIPYWPKNQIAGWLRTSVTQVAGTDSALRAREQRIDRRLAFVKKLYDLKVPLLAGTDAPAGFDLVPGPSVHRELQLFVRGGLTPLQALQTSTINPAIFLGKEAELGTVTEGKIADFVVLARNPLVDISNTLSTVAVVADGRYYSPADLNRMRIHLIELAAK